jgi:hypothetical protein
MPGAQEQLLACHMRGVDQLVVALQDHVLDEPSQLEIHHRALGVPHDQPRAHVLLDRVQVELLAEEAVIALARLFEPPQVRLKVVLGQPRRAVNALQHLAALVTAPVRARGVQQLEVLDAPGARDVRPAAQIHERPVGVHRDHLVRAEVVDPLEL